MRARWRLIIFGAVVQGALSACQSLPEPTFHPVSFPKDDVFLTDVKRPYEKLGEVKTRVDYDSLDYKRDEQELCRNYFNKAVRDLLKMAKKQGADAVIDVKSVVFYEDGKFELFAKPECADDGEGGQVLVRGVAVKWKPEPASSSLTH